MLSHHPHPRPQQARLTQYSALAVFLLMLLTVGLQAVLALALGGLLMLLTALITLLLALFLIPPTATTPAVTVTPDGLRLHPVVWRERFVPWSAVSAVKRYPLLPHPDAEMSRRALTGRANYQPAAGIMLVIPGLPPQYRVAGFLAGERGQPIIALTNRTHTDYNTLIEQIATYTGQPHDDIFPQAGADS